MTMPMPADIPSPSEIAAEIQRHRGWFVFLGVLLIVAGALDIMFPLAGSLTVEVWAAIAFAIAGVSQLVHAFGTRAWTGFWLQLLTGLLYLGAGIVLWLNPINGIITLTVFLAAVYLVDGIFRILLALRLRGHGGWILILLSGLLGIVVAAMIILHLPSSAAWALGLLLGIYLIFTGASFLSLVWSGPAASTGATKA